jgi:hypothetical protein
VRPSGPVRQGESRGQEGVTKSRGFALNDMR